MSDCLNFFTRDLEVNSAKTNTILTVLINKCLKKLLQSSVTLFNKCLESVLIPCCSKLNCLFIRNIFSKVFTTSPL